MHACDIHQYLIRQNIFSTTSPKFTLANNFLYGIFSVFLEMVRWGGATAGARQYILIIS